MAIRTSYYNVTSVFPSPAIVRPCHNWSNELGCFWRPHGWTGLVAAAGLSSKAPVCDCSEDWGQHQTLQVVLALPSLSSFSPKLQVQQQHDSPGPRHQSRGGVPLPGLQVPACHHERWQRGQHQLDEVLGRPCRLLHHRDPGGSSPRLPAWLPSWQMSVPGVVYGPIQTQWVKPRIHSGIEQLAMGQWEK